MHVSAMRNPNQNSFAIGRTTELGGFDTQHSWEAANQSSYDAWPARLIAAAIVRTVKVRVHAFDDHWFLEMIGNWLLVK
jgi:hypothetical protein